MKQALFACLALAALAPCRAGAADMSVRAPVRKAPPARAMAAYDWSGFYAGVHGGGAWASKQFTDVTFDPLNDGSIDDGGWLAGGQIGFNWQVGAVVLGLEADGSVADVGGERMSLAFPDDRITTEVHGLGTVAARLGYAMDNVLVYAKGGAAWVRDEHVFFNTDSDVTIGTIEDTRWGWLAGAGVEYGFSPGWSLKLEYNYMDFGKATYRGVVCAPDECTGGVFDETIAQHIHVVKVGLNYRFGGPSAVVAKY
jgi:outer membrane immunogenic protein